MARQDASRRSVADPTDITRHRFSSYKAVPIGRHARDDAVMRPRARAKKYETRRRQKTKERIDSSMQTTHTYYPVYRSLNKMKSMLCRSHPRAPHRVAYPNFNLQ